MAVATQWRNVGELGTNPIPDNVPNLLESMESSWVDMDYIVGRILWFLTLGSNSIKSHLPYTTAVSRSTDTIENDQSSINAVNNTAKTHLILESDYDITLKTESIRLRRALVAYNQTAKLIKEYARYTPRCDFNPEIDCSPFTGTLFDHHTDDTLVGSSGSGTESLGSPTIMAAVADTLKQVETLGEFVTETILAPAILLTDHSWLEHEYMCVLILRLKRNTVTTITATRTSLAAAVTAAEQGNEANLKEITEVLRDGVVTDTLLWQLFWRLYFNVTIAILPHLESRMHGLVTISIQNEICRDIFRTRYSVLTPNSTEGASRTSFLSASPSSTQGRPWIPGFQFGSTEAPAGHPRPQDDGSFDEPVAKLCRRAKRTCIFSDTFGDEMTDRPAAATAAPLQAVTRTLNNLLADNCRQRLAVAIDKERALVIMPIITIIIDSVEKAQIYAQQFGPRYHGGIERTLRPFRSRDRSPFLHQFLLRLAKGCTPKLQEATEQFGDLMVGSDPPPGEAETIQRGRADIATYVSMAFLSATDCIPVPRIDLSSMTNIPLNRPPISLVVLNPGHAAGAANVRNGRRGGGGGVAKSVSKTGTVVTDLSTLPALEIIGSPEQTTSVPVPGEAGRWATAARKAEALGYTKVALGHDNSNRTDKGPAADNCPPREETKEPLALTLPVVRSEYGNVLTLQMLLFIFQLTLVQLDGRKSSWGDTGGRKVPHDKSTDYATLSHLIPELVAIDQRIVKTVRDYLASQERRRNRGPHLERPKQRQSPSNSSSRSVPSHTLPPSLPEASGRKDNATDAVPSFEICRTLFLAHYDDFVWVAGTLAVKTNLWRTLQGLQTDMIVERTTGTTGKEATASSTSNSKSRHHNDDAAERDEPLDFSEEEYGDDDDDFAVTRCSPTYNAYADDTDSAERKLMQGLSSVTLNGTTDSFEHSQYVDRTNRHDNATTTRDIWTDHSSSPMDMV